VHGNIFHLNVQTRWMYQRIG